MTPELLADPAEAAFVDHIVRILGENLVERWAAANAGELFAGFYTHEALGQPLETPGWARIWVLRDAGYVVAHASLYDRGEPDGVVFGHIGIERSHRRRGLADLLNAARFDFCDAHGLTLAGPVAVDNHASLKMCARWGYLPMHTEAGRDGGPDVLWMYRPPGAAANLTPAAEAGLSSF